MASETFGAQKARQRGNGRVWVNFFINDPTSKYLPAEKTKEVSSLPYSTAKDRKVNSCCSKCQKPVCKDHSISVMKEIIKLTQ